MIWQRRAGRPARRMIFTRLQFGMLESRELLAADLSGLTALLVANGHPAGCCCPACGGGPLPPLAADSERGSATDTAAAGASAATYPLSSIPILNSLPGARATLYLDFDGHYEAQWGSYSNITTPAFDQDGDPTTFSSGELAAIEQIWRYTAEDYAPFNVNVTTALPSSFANGVALRAAIGGDGSWTGATYGGIGYVNSFTNSVPNTVFVFSKHLSNGNARYTGDAISHESGHGFGLQHQSEYSGSAKVAEY